MNTITLKLQITATPYSKDKSQPLTNPRDSLDSINGVRSKRVLIKKYSC